eukprot:COSAG02_NODE_343_length_24147_cov_30.662051_2_plen_205_part_00
MLHFEQVRVGGAGPASVFESGVPGNGDVAQGGADDAQLMLETGEAEEELLSSIFGGAAGQQNADAHQLDAAAGAATAAAVTTSGGLAFNTAPGPDAAAAPPVARTPAVPVGPPEPLEWGGHTAGSEFKPSQLSRLCREIGASDEQMDACADGDDPKAEYMALLRPSRLHRRCAALGLYSEAELEACADAEAPQLEYIRLLVQKR